MRSPAVPRSAISLRSPVAIRRPSGIFAGGGGGDVWAIGAGAGGAGAGVDFSAITIGVADAEGCGVGLPLANLPFGVGVAFAPAFPFLGWTCTIGGGVTALAASTRTS